MEYLIGLVLLLAVVAAVNVIGFDRDRSYYPVLMVVIAAYYVLFAAMPSGQAIIAETVVAIGFCALAVLGFKKNLWFAAGAITGHGVFDLVHHLFIYNPGVPPWWPGFCFTADVVLGAALAVQLMKHNARP